MSVTIWSWTRSSQRRLLSWSRATLYVISLSLFSRTGLADVLQRWSYRTDE